MRLVQGLAPEPSGYQGSVKGCVERQLWAQEDVRPPVSCWVGLCSHHVGFLAWGIPPLAPTGETRFQCQNGDLQKSPHLGPLALRPCPQMSVSRPPLPQETFQRPPRVLWSHFFTLDPRAHESLHESFPEGGAWYGVQNFLFCRRTSWYNYFAVCKLWFDYIMNLPPYHLIVAFSLSLELQYLFW